MLDEDKARKIRSDVLGKLIRGFIELFAEERVKDSERNPNNKINLESTTSTLDASLNSRWEPRDREIESKNAGDYYTIQQLNDKHVKDTAHAASTDIPIITASISTPTPYPTDTKKTLTSEEIARIYAEVTPSEYMPEVDKGTPARSYTDSQLALLRARSLGAYRDGGEYTQESMASQEKNEELLNLYCEKDGIPRIFSASAFPSENGEYKGAHIIETFTRDPLFDVVSNDESQIDLNNIKKYPMNNVSAAMAGYQILSSHKIAQSDDVKRKF